MAGTLTSAGERIVAGHVAYRRPHVPGTHTASRLLEHPIGWHCRPSDLRRLIWAADPAVVTAGSCVQPRQPLRWVYVLLRGAVTVEFGDRLELISGAELIGVRSALLETCPIVALTAVADSEMLVISDADFRVATRRSAAIGSAVSRYLARKVDIA